MSVSTEKLQHALESTQAGRFDEAWRVLNRMEYLNLEQSQFLIIVASLLIAAFLIAFYNDTGLAALIRDLLISNSYRSTQVVAYGRMYFKPAFTFKGSFYLIAGFVVVMISPILFCFTRCWLPDSRMDFDRALCAAPTCHLHQFPITWDEVYHY